jgi:diguanylate cyclase (GGDEF)-like protein
MSGNVVRTSYHGGHWFDLSGAFGDSMAPQGDATELQHHDEVPEAHLHGTARNLRRGVREWFQGFSPAGAAIIAAALVMAVAAADAYAGPGVDMTLLYLGPIGFGTFFAGLGAGAGLAILAAACSLESSRLAGEQIAPAVMAWDAAQQLGVFLVLAGVLDAFKKRLLHEQQAARTDSLTSLANRRAFVESAWVELERARRHGRPLSLLYIDCDDFKAVNDRLGHVGGDAVLAAVGATLQEAVRGHDTVARLGGDEFGILLPEIDGPGAAALAERLRVQLGETLTGRWDRVTFSIGVATFVTPPASVDEMILRADELMYQAKRSGKDGWRAATWGVTETAA